MSLLDSLWVTKNAITGAFEAVKNEASQLAGNLLLPKNKKSMAFPVNASQPVLNKPNNTPTTIYNLPQQIKANTAAQQAQQADTMAKKQSKLNARRERRSENV
jgi:hypothetical protein